MTDYEYEKVPEEETFPVPRFVDAIFNITGVQAEEEKTRALWHVVENSNTMVDDLGTIHQWQERFEQLSYEDKLKIRSHFLNIFSILGIEPGTQFEEGQNYFQWFQFLITTANDHTVRIGRIEQLMEQIFAHLSTQGFTQKSTHSPTLAELKQNEKISTHIVEEPSEAIYAPTDTDSDSDSDSDMSGVSERPRTYGEIRYLRSVYPGMPVKDFCTKFGISEQSYYRAMRKGRS